MLEQALSSGNTLILILTAGALGFLHTIMGPDHYVPFVMMARAENWSKTKTAVVTFLCGIGHVASSAVIGGILIGLGWAADNWQHSRLAAFHHWRGAVAAWALMGIGIAYAIWGLIRIKRGHVHTHKHIHIDGAEHVHLHNHAEEHMHVHTEKKSITPWILFTVFIFGPCEALIPLMLAAWALVDITGVVSVTIVFSITTIITIMATVSVLLAGVSHISFGFLEKYTHVLAGVSLVLCGAAIQFLGL